MFRPPYQILDPPLAVLGHVMFSNLCELAAKTVVCDQLIWVFIFLPPFADHFLCFQCRANNDFHVLAEHFKTVL
jgi:hypothetical protein